jgi:hypothetical protein
MLNPERGPVWVNPSKKLVDRAIDQWRQCNLRADNTSIVTVMLDPPGPPRAQVLRKQRMLREDVKGVTTVSKLKRRNASPPSSSPPPALPPKPGMAGVAKGIAIISRFPNSSNRDEKQGLNLIGGSHNGHGGPGAESRPPPPRPQVASPSVVTRIVHDSVQANVQKLRVKTPSAANDDLIQNLKDSKSPSPPPLPAKPPGGLAPKRSLVGALNRAAAAAAATTAKEDKQWQPLRSPNTIGLPQPSKARDEEAPPPIYRPGKDTAKRVLSQTAALGAAKPVKQVRRSTVPIPEIDETASDRENEPVVVMRRLRSPPKTRVATRRSLACAKTFKPSLARGRRSVPSAVTAAGDNKPLEPANRILRPRNKDETDPSPNLSSGGKRKRRSSGANARDGKTTCGRVQASLSEAPIPVVGERPRMLNAKSALDTASSAAKKARLLRRK